jgi:hypothetical protein
MKSIDVFASEDAVVILIPKKRAASMGVLLDACLNTAGALVAADVGLISADMDQAEEDLILLAEKITGVS